MSSRRVKTLAGVWRSYDNLNVWMYAWKGSHLACTSKRFRIIWPVKLSNFTRFTLLFPVSKTGTVFYGHLGWPNFILLRITCVSFWVPIFFGPITQAWPFLRFENNLREIECAMGHIKLDQVKRSLSCLLWPFGLWRNHAGNYRLYRLYTPDICDHLIIVAILWPLWQHVSMHYLFHLH